MARSRADNSHFVAAALPAAALSAAARSDSSTIRQQQAAAKYGFPGRALCVQRKNWGTVLFADFEIHAVLAISLKQCGRHNVVWVCILWELCRFRSPQPFCLVIYKLRQPWFGLRHNVPAVACHKTRPYNCIVSYTISQLQIMWFIRMVFVLPEKAVSDGANRKNGIPRSR